MGVPLEFFKREDLQKNPIKKMMGHGSHNMPKGSWSDDSSMVLATIDSILENKNIDCDSLMKNFSKWIVEGKYTPDGKTFGIGRTTLKSIHKYKEGKSYLECGCDGINDNGNGSLMRILPISLFTFYGCSNNKEIYELVKSTSSLTHSHNISVLGCFIYTLLIKAIIDYGDKQQAYNAIKTADYSMFKDEIVQQYEKIIKYDITNYNIDEIKSTGYVVDTLESAIWCFMKGTNYKDTIIEAINLGGDTDTISAIAGGLSGLYCSMIDNEIPIQKNWISSLRKKDYIIEICRKYGRFISNELPNRIVLNKFLNKKD